jgi:hypothetical protein
MRVVLRPSHQHKLAWTEQQCRAPFMVDAICSKNKGETASENKSAPFKNEGITSGSS